MIPQNNIWIQSIGIKLKYSELKLNEDAQKKQLYTKVKIFYLLS